MSVYHWYDTRVTKLRPSSSKLAKRLVYALSAISRFRSPRSPLPSLAVRRPVLMRGPAEIEVVHAIAVGWYVVVAHTVISLGKPATPADHAVEGVYPKLDPCNNRQWHIVEQIFAGIVILALT